MKIAIAASNALQAVKVDKEEADREGLDIANCVTEVFKKRVEVSYNEIHDQVELVLMDVNKAAAKAYIIYRQTRTNAREGRDPLIEKMVAISSQVSKDNANIRNGPSSKMYEMASAVNSYYIKSQLLPKDIADAFEVGDIHLHDANYYQLTYNCLNYDLKKLLQNGFRMPHGFIRTPKTIMAASALTAVSLQSVQNN
jgi:ribonucleoside-triphosphate reductase